MNEQAIDRVYVTKFLGVLIDSKLNWKQHIDRTRNKLAKCTALLYKASDVFDSNTVYMLYCSLFLPYLNYCVEIWGNTYVSNINKIMVIQKRAIRIVHYANRYTHSNPLFSRCKTIKLYDIIRYKTGIFMYEAYHSNLPTNLQTYFTLVHENSDHNTRQRDNFRVTFARTTLRKSSLIWQGVFIWNSLEENLKKSKTLASFKKQYKLTLLNGYA